MIFNSSEYILQGFMILQSRNYLLKTKYMNYPECNSPFNNYLAKMTS